MTYCVEPFIQDSVWRWLDQNKQYTQVAGEIQIGTGINSGRIDLIAKTTDDRYHGFEIKDKDFADEQLNRYLYSGDLDQLYHCSRRGDEIASRLNEDRSFKNTTFSNQQIRKQVSNGIAAGQYTKEEYIQRLENAFPENILDQQASIGSSTNRRILNDDEKTVRARLTRNLGIPTADFDPSETYIGLDEAIGLMTNNMHLPESIGVLDVPFSYDATGSASESFRLTVDEPAAEVFSKVRWKEIQVLRDPQALDRERIPSLPRTNEAWVQHYTWWHGGDIREGVIPHPELNSELLIDIMTFEGGDTPTEVFQEGENARCIGIEAKGAASLQHIDDLSKIQSQLNNYRTSGALTHLYLAVPKIHEDEGKRIISTDKLSGVGLMTVDQEGEIEAISDPERMVMKFDGYIEVSGAHEYTRSIGFGRLRPSDEGEPTSPCRVETRGQRS